MAAQTNYSLPDIVIAGSGLQGTLQMTRETESILKSCKKVFVLHDDPSVINFVRNLNVEVINALQYYEDGIERNKVYEKLADHILFNAHKERTGLLVHGHPLFLVSTTESILTKAEAENLKVRVYAGVSSLDNLFVDLGVDFGYALQIYDATYFVKKKPLIDPSSPLLIFQVSILQQQQVTKNYEKPNLNELKETLLNYYPEDHPVAYVLSSVHPFVPTEIHWSTIQELEDIDLELLEKRPTLFLPQKESQFA